MSQTDEQLVRIQQKVQQLLKRHNDLRIQNTELEKKLHSLSLQRDQQMELIEQLQQKLEVLKISRSDLSEEEKKVFEKKLTQYIKEIDRCISMLSE